MINMDIRTVVFLIISAFFWSAGLAQENAISNAIKDQNKDQNSFELAVNNPKNTIKPKNKPNKLWRGWSVAISYGATQFDGDIRQYDHYPAYQETGDFYELKSALSFKMTKRLNPFIELQGELIGGKFAGLKRKEAYYNLTADDPWGNNYEGNGEKFITDFKEIDALVNIDLLNTLSYFTSIKTIDKFIFLGRVGMGYNIFHSVKRNLFSNTYISSRGYTDEGDNYPGSDYGTEKASFFSSPSETVYILGLLIKYPINERLNIDLEYTHRKGSTDKWDASIMNSTAANDSYDFVGMGLSFRLGKKQKTKEWSSPIDYLKTNVEELKINIVGLTDDADNDGVSDAFDKSPNTPLGVAVDGAGIPLDVDMDNIPDYRDADPFSNRAAQVDIHGVELDDDKDGVPNSKDLESNTPIGVMVNQFGINISNTTYINAGGMIYFPSIYFNSGSAIVGSSNENRIATMALMLKNNPDINMNVIGHTDNAGTLEFNKKLGLKRANAVINYLANNYNIDADRLTPTTKGKEDPLSTVTQISSGLEGGVKVNNLAEINRRVDFEIAD